MRIRMFRNRYLFVVGLLILLLPALTFAFQGTCINVAEGDTITVLTTSKKQIKVRLYGIDCPEKKQDYGQKAKQFTLSLTGRKSVDVKRIGVDRYGRTVGIVFVGPVCVNVELLKSGYAWLYDRYCKKSFCVEWKNYERQARKGRIGFWRDPDPVAPWDYRRGGKKAKPDEAEGYVRTAIKVVTLVMRVVGELF